MDRTNIIDIASYDFNKMKINGFFLVLGKRGTGKSTYTSYALQFSRYRTTGVFTVMCGNVSVKQTWAKTVPKLFCIDANVEYFTRLRHEQEKQIAKYGEDKLPDKHHVTLILDDIASSKTIMRSQELISLASDSRHLGITIFLLAQYIFQAPSEIRSQFDTIFVLSTSNRRNITTIHDEFVGSVPIRVFRRVLEAVTDDYGLLVIDNNINGSIEKICSYAKIANYPPELDKLGSPALWEYSRTHYLNIEKLRYTQANLREHETDRENDYEDDIERDGVFMQVVSANKVFHDRFGKIIVRQQQALINHKKKTD